MIVNRFFTSLLFVPALLFLSCIARAESAVESSVPALNEGDFSVLLNDYAFTPGDNWSNESFVRAGKALSSVLAGEVDINNQQYTTFSIPTTALSYLARQRLEMPATRFWLRSF